MRSDAMKKGIERAPQRAALYAVGCGKSDLNKPFIGVINSILNLPHLYYEKQKTRHPQNFYVIVSPKTLNFPPFDYSQLQRV